MYELVELWQINSLGSVVREHNYYQENNSLWIIDTLCMINECTPLKVGTLIAVTRPSKLVCHYSTSLNMI